MFSSIKKIHFVGVGGICMSGIAEILLDQGFKVSGSDRALSEVTDRLVKLGAEIMEGQIFGVAGLLVGLSRLWNMKGLCLLAETPGFYPDAEAAREILNAVCKMLHLKVDTNRLDNAAASTREILGAFGISEPPKEEKPSEEEKSHRWHI